MHADLHLGAHGRPSTCDSDGARLQPWLRSAEVNCLRPHGGYVVEVKSVKGSSKMDVLPQRFDRQSPVTHVAVAARFAERVAVNLLERPHPAGAA